MKIGVPKETVDGERRVALVPDVVKSLKKNEKLDVVVERGAGDAAGHPDSQYEEAGAELVDPDVAWGADVVLRVDPDPPGADLVRDGAKVVLREVMSPTRSRDQHQRHRRLRARDREGLHFFDQRSG